ncbi:MAG: hypothetical protein WCS21_10540 [Lachnospiraceae bacterium]
MKFIISDYQPATDKFILADIYALDKALQALSCNDISAAQETYFEMDKLYRNIASFNVSNQLRDLIGDVAAKWEVNLASQESALSDIGGALKTAGTAIWNSIMAMVRKIRDFIGKYFAKDRTAAVVKQVPVAESKIKTVLALPNTAKEDEITVNTAEIKKEIDDSTDDKNAGAAGQVAAAKLDTVSRSEYESSIASAKAMVEELQKRLREKTTSADQSAAAAREAASENENLAKKIGELRAAGAKLSEALDLSNSVVDQKTAKLNDLKKVGQMVEFVIADQGRLIQLQLNFYRGCLAIAARMCGSIESVIKRSLSVETIKNVKDLLDSKINFELPASAIPAAAEELSRLVTILENTQFESADAFVDWREKSTENLSYIKLDGVTPVLNPQAEKANSTAGKLGYIKDIISGAIGKKYEGTAAVANKINALLARLESDAVKLGALTSTLSQMK